MENNPEIWLVVFYGVGTWFGHTLGRRGGLRDGASRCIDILIENKFVKWRKDKNGEVELIPLKND